MSPHDFGDMHESALIFVPAATFGQLIQKCDTALQPLQLPGEFEIVKVWIGLVDLSRILCGTPSKTRYVLWRVDFSLDDVWHLFARFSAEKSRSLAKTPQSEAGNGLICCGRKKLVWQRHGDCTFSTAKLRLLPKS
jgi:hypothetical protein